MFKYQGAHCPYCKKELTPNDEILICPECGAPYHRECVKESGGCVLTDLHEKGEMWQPPAAASHASSEAPPFDGMAPLRCGRCGTVNPPDRLFCEVCGHELNKKFEGDAPGSPSFGAGGGTPGGFGPAQNQGPNAQGPGFGPGVPPYQMPYNPYTTPFGGLAPDEEIDGVSVHDLAIYVGDNTHYFLPKFKEFKNSRRIVSWNWPAFFLDFYYLMYRKLWGWAIMMLVLSLLLSAPSLLITAESAVLMVNENASLLAELNINPEKLILLSNFFSFLSMGLKLLLATTVNRLYANKAFKEVKNLKAQYENAPDYSMRLRAKGGPSRMAVVVAAAVTMAVSMIVSVLTMTLMTM
ncbi:MAG: DUF2628 domain-containing protein [Oscillospiraceae bacterium]|jgi:hypothetical protein|nr:DUF2628 domain-containing protein [Oscillospiraceae bacterium]